MEFTVIPDKQTPKVCYFSFEIMTDYIKEHREKLEAFLEFAKTKTNAVGLAANQCAVDDKRFMMRAFALCDIFTRKWSLVIDPKITKCFGILETKGEGCLTWKNRVIVAERHRQVEVSYYDIDGNFHKDEVYKGFEAQIWQHEVNHLNGVEEDVRDYYVDSPSIKVGRNELCPCGASEIELDVFVLHQKYEEGKTLKEVGDLISKCGKTIGRLFKKHGLHIRTKSENQLGVKNSSFNPNPIYRKDGYVEIWDGEKRVLEHRFVMEKHLDRKLLKEEIVHHRNGIKDDNEPKNLKIVTNSTHRKEHKLPQNQWSKNYEHCIKCGTTNKKHAGNGYCTKCYMYVRTVEKRGYECEYDENGNRNFSKEHIENLKKSAIIREKKKKYKHCCLI